jgi:malate dehydrogenase (oxaloacetate-decarboxylating)
MYMGWRHARVRGQAYDEFIDTFIQAVARQLPRVLLQWEDFAQVNASRLLERCRDRLCTFTDDIQGTAAVTMGTLMAAIKVTGARLRDQQVAVVGAGSAGSGICAQLMAAMQREGLPAAEARSRFWLIDRSGLLREGMTNLLPFQETFAQPRERLAGWKLTRPESIGLMDVMTNVNPTILIGTSGQPGLFTEDIIRTMAQHVPRPIILPLSNPTSRAEARPEDLIAWTDGRALVATGSPFGDVPYQGRRIRTAQCNNSYIFPAMGLGILSVRARRVTESMFMVAAQALAECSPALSDPQGALLPPLEDIRGVSRRVALAVAAEAQRQGVAERAPAEASERLVDAKMWTPHYSRLRRRAG